MKTQIKDLRNGAKRIILNDDVKYNLAFNGQVVGSSASTIEEVWAKVCQENPETMKIRVFGVDIELLKKSSMSGKTVVYSAGVDDDFLKQCCLMPSRNPRISGGVTIQRNLISVSNGKNDNIYICPSLIEIL